MKNPKISSAKQKPREEGRKCVWSPDQTILDKQDCLNWNDLMKSADSGLVYGAKLGPLSLKTKSKNKKKYWSEAKKNFLLFQNKLNKLNYYLQIVNFLSFKT